MNEPSVAIVLVNYNGYEYTKNCIDSLNQIDYSNFGIIIVDNDSPDGSVKQLYEFESPRIHVIETHKNGGFAYGNNVGISYARSLGYSFVLLLNNDTIVTKRFLTRIVSSAIRYGGDITSGRIMYNGKKDTIWYAGGKIDWFNQRAIHVGINKKNPMHKNTCRVSFVSGCCMLLSMKCIDTIGGLPEDYFMYYEDLDYCQNALNHGLNLLYSPKSVIYHCISASGGGDGSPFVVEWSNRSRRKFYKKYSSNLAWYIRWTSSFWCEMKEIYRIIRRGNKIASLKAYIRSFNES